jgi:hypothetical protein
MPPYLAHEELPLKLFFVCTWLFFFSIGLFSGLEPNVSAAPPALIVLLLPGTSLADWQDADAPNLHRLMQTGALAVMNTRTAHRAGAHERETPQSALLTLGAGSRAAGASADTPFLPLLAVVPGTAVQAGALYTRRTGLVPRPGRSVCVPWPAVLKANTDLGYDLRLGSLAETLKTHGMQIKAGGGADADWIAADPHGTVQHISKLQAAPGLCLIWDAGPNAAAADAVIGIAARQVDRLSGRLVVISPYAGSAAYARNERLTPVLVWEANLPAGLLLSPSTRRPGLVTNTDFAPAVAGYFGILRTSFRSLPFGFAWSESASLNPAGDAARLSRDAVRQARGMTLLPYLALGLGFWILATTLLTVRRRLFSLWTLVPVTALPAALFAVSLASFFVLLLCLLALALIFARFAGTTAISTFLVTGLTAALTLDMVTGNTLMHSGLLGYSVIEGARYYGIGNEAMGLLLGAALVAAARLWSGDRSRRLIVVLFMAGIVLLLGSVGAKAGGLLVSLAVFGTFLYTVSGCFWTKRRGLLLGGIVAAGMAVAALGDAFLLPRGHSHIGEAVSRISSGGSGEAWDIIRRKLAVEGRLAYHSAWAALLWACVFCLTFLWKRVPPKGRIDAALRSAGGVGLLACFLLNDAGVIAAALFAVVLWSEIVTQKSLSALEFSRAERLG